MTDGNEDLSRRVFLRTATGVAAASAAAGTAAAQEEDGGGGGGGGTKTVTVGPGGSLVFEPETIQVTPGMTIEWTWDSDNHNIVVDSQPDGANWEGTEGDATVTYDTGHTYSHTFETLGTYEYACEPHRTAGMLGSVEVVETISTPAPVNIPEVPQSAKALGVATSVVMVATLGLSFFFLKYGGDYGDSDEY